MPSPNSPPIIVARFLQANNYNATLEAFLTEAGLPPDAGAGGKGYLTVERMLEEVRMGGLGGGVGAPEIPTELHISSTPANWLHVSVETVQDDGSDASQQVICATTADRRFHLAAANTGAFHGTDSIHDSPILSCVATGGKGSWRTVSTSMSGQVVLYDHKDEAVLDERRDHKKYVVKAAAWEASDLTWIATAGWDAKIFLYSIPVSRACSLGSPVGFLSLSTNPETVTFIRHPDSESPILLITRRDSTLLYFYALPMHNESPDPSSVPHELQLLGTQNLAPHSSNWVSFSLSAVSLCPTDPTLLAVATSAVPHMRLIVVRLMFPPLERPLLPRNEPATQADQAREKLITQDREDAMILIHVNTMAPQTPYSTPQVSWRPDGTGIWVNGDDGVVRGIEAQSGKIVATLKDGHEAGSKIRSLWAGMVNFIGRYQECVLSGGFDKKLIIWLTEEE